MTDNLKKISELGYRAQFNMTKKQLEKPRVEESGPELRYAVVFMDNRTKVQVAAGTDDLDKFTKTDLMKMVEAFKKGVKDEEKFDFTRRKQAEKELKDEPDKRGNSKVSKRVRRPRKVSKP